MWYPGGVPPGPTIRLLLGRDHETLGALDVVAVSPHTACVLAAGADGAYDPAAAKTHPNEDALLVIEDARHTVLAVADAHFGREASEELLTLLRDALLPVPENPERLAAVFARLAAARPPSRHGSETTLAVCILDRLFRQAFGLAFGDSSVMRMAPGADPLLVHERSQEFVSAADPPSLDPRGAQRFAFSPARGELLLVFTDGVNECCYRDPDRSLTAERMGELLRTGPSDAPAVVETLARAALEGVGGHAGGEDNVALAVTVV